MKSFIGNTSSIGMLNSTRLVAYTSAVCLFVFLTLLAFPVTSTSEEAVASTGTAVAADTTLTLSSTNENSLVNVVSTSPQGTFASSDTNGTANFSVTTNNFTGYTLSISSDDDAGRLENYTHDYISSITANLSEADFSNASNTTYNNKWGFKPNKYVSSNTVVDNTGSSSVFLPSPTTAPTVLNITSAANTTDDDYTLGLGIRADVLLPSGTYSKTLNLIALANAAPYTVSFNQNTADTVTNMPTSLGGSTSATSISIPNTTPARANYTFMGWCDRKDTINECPTGGHTFQPGGSYGIDQTDDNTSVTLYAMWQPNFYMQEVATWGQSLAVGDSVQAIDRRDGKVYWVTKEETDPANPRAEIDVTTGKAYQIWMTQNLDLDLDSTEALTPDTSDVIASWTPANSTLTDISDWVVDANTPYSYSAGDVYYYTSGTTEDDLTYNSLTACVEANHSVEECMHYGVGNYYNWNAAIANNDTAAIIGDDYIQMAESICPAGWRLPTGLTSVNDYTDFDYLLYKNGVTVNHENAGFDAVYATDGFNAIRVDPLWLTRSGLIYNQTGSFTDGSINAYYWGNTPYGYNANHSAKNLRFGSNEVYPTRSSTRNNGFSVRCVARAEKTMQSVATWQDELAIGDSVQAVDLRDNKIYWVTKEETDPANPRAEIDATTGKAYQIWMTQNLDYDIKATEPLVPATSDVTASWTPARSTTNDVSIWANDYNVPYSYDNGEAYYYTSGINGDDIYYSDIEACIEANHSAGDCRHYRTGNYYNWSSAVASNDTSSITTNYTQAPDSVCPAGWRLPTSLTVVDGYSDFDYLFYKNGITATHGGVNVNVGYAADGLSILRASPLWSTRSGDWSGSVLYQGTYARYWSSSTYSSTDSYYLSFSTGSIGPAYKTSRANGFSIRCLARNTMQDSTATSVAAFTDTAQGNTTKLIDKRDGSIYTVGKLPDGTIWMLDNLRLGGSESVDVSSEDTNMPEGTTFTIPASSTLNVWSLVPAINSDNKNESLSYGNGDGLIGNYYNFCVATAGTICTETNTSTATYDICPKGWRMPIGSEYSSLYTYYGSDITDFRNALHLTLAGGWNNSSDGDSKGVLGGYWTSSWQNPTAMKALWLSLPSTVVVSGNDRGHRSSIRCVRIDTMQNIASWGTNLQANQTKYAEDIRDGEIYTVGRLADNKIWLLDNLRLGGANPIELTQANSNVTANFTLPGSISSGFGSFTLPQINSDSKYDISSYGSTTAQMGNLYNYCAVSAGTICDAEGVNENDASEDICPAGWRLTTGGASGDWKNLSDAVNDVDNLISSLRLVGSGAYSSAGLTDVDAANYWASTKTANNGQMHGAGFLLDENNLRISPTAFNHRNYGFSARCIAK